MTTPGPDGSAVFVDEALVDQSVNAALLAAGHAYPAFYATLPADAAHPPGRGLAGRPGRAAAGRAVAPLHRRPRRRRHRRRPRRPGAAGHLAQAVPPDRALPRRRLHRLRRLRRLAARRPGPPRRRALPDRHAASAATCTTSSAASGQQIQLTVWPEDFIISPDPAPPGATTGPRLVAAGDVLIVAALPDPIGVDRGNELVTLVNTTAAPVDLTGWALVDAAGGRQALTGTTAGGAVAQVAGRHRPAARQPGRHRRPRRARRCHDRPGHLQGRRGPVGSHHLLRPVSAAAPAVPARRAPG